MHFAYHGVQNTSDPIESALLVSRLTLSKIIKMNLPHAELAFLNCHRCEGSGGRVCSSRRWDVDCRISQCHCDDVVHCGRRCP